ncbi:hypothetical protein ACWELO_03980 [Streptomyces sp. NPDC004596]
MAIDERPDPVQIIPRVGTGFSAEQPERAIQVWMYVAAKAGWDVSRVDEASVDLDAGECGIVEPQRGPTMPNPWAPTRRNSRITHLPAYTPTSRNGPAAPNRRAAGPL